MSKVADLIFRAIEKKRKFFVRSANALITISGKTTGNRDVKNVNSEQLCAEATLWKLPIYLLESMLP
jgi:hypothetical protein